MTKIIIRGLYAITEPVLLRGEEFVLNVELVLRSGTRLIQYRDKIHSFEEKSYYAKSLKSLCHDYNACLIINDDISLAQLVNADGVHLGQEDASIIEARKILGKDKIIGASCYNSFKMAEKMQKSGADYIALGAFFPSKTKPNAPLASLDTLKKVKKKLSIDVVAIGGVDLTNATTLINAGADAIAVISGIFASTDIYKTSKDFNDLFKKNVIPDECTNKNI